MASSKPTSARSNINPQLAILRKRAWMILLLFAVTMITILVQARLAKPVYRAVVRLQVVVVESEQIALYGPDPGAFDADLAAFLFRDAVVSGAVAWRTIGQLGLSMSADQLLRDITATQQSGSVTVTVMADSPQAAEAIATTQVENALTAYREDRMGPTIVIGDFLESQLAAADQILAAASTALQQFKLDHGFDSLEREIVGYQDIIRGLRREQDNAALAMVQLKARIRVLEAEARANQATADAAPSGSDEKALAVRRASDQISLIASLRGDLAAQEAAHLEYEASIKRWETELTSLIGLSAENSRLINAVARAQNTRDFLANKAFEAGLKRRQAESIGYLRVVEPARRPDQPIPSRTLQIALVGGLLSLVVGAVLAFLFERIEVVVKRVSPKA